MIEIVEYRTEWPSEFRDIAGVLRSRLGNEALRIDHIGSTSVPGLASKDILDIQVSVANFEDSLLQRLVEIGYTKAVNINSDHRPPISNTTDQEWQKWFFYPPRSQRATNLHVRIMGRANQQYALLFRDYLRTHSAMAAAYGTLKKQLAAELREDSRYPDVKDPAVDLIYFAALDWASISGWQLGPSDA